MMCEIEPHLLRFIGEASSKVYFTRLKHHFNKQYQVNTKALRKALADLIQAGKLCYTSHYGQSFIELSFDRPQLVSDHVVIKSPDCSWEPSAGQWVISLERGAAFGGGEHPSTRLAIQLIDVFLHRSSWKKKNKDLCAIDIGTGSGILALVAAKMGVGRVYGLDIDPCARFEASKNVRRNHMEDRVHILDRKLQAVNGSFDLVIANLRAPTLNQIRTLLDKKATIDATLFFSGLKTEDIVPICDTYKKFGFNLVLERFENGWGAICLTRDVLVDSGPVPI